MAEAWLVGSQEPHLVPPGGYRGPSSSTALCCIPRHISRKLDQKWNSWESRTGTHRGWGGCRQDLSLSVDHDSSVPSQGWKLVCPGSVFLGYLCLGHVSSNWLTSCPCVHIFPCFSERLVQSWCAITMDVCIVKQWLVRCWKYPDLKGLLQVNFLCWLGSRKLQVSV